MTNREHTKLDLMIFAIKNDFFGYGSTCEKRSDGRYVSKIEGDIYIESGKTLASHWDEIDDTDKQNILEYFAEKELQVKLKEAC